jgi:putative ABC transport system permease protein
MVAAFSLAWSQLSRQRLRLSIALGGVAFAVVLMLMQLGFQTSLFDSATRLHRLLEADLCVIHADSHGMQSVKSFSDRAVYQALGEPEVTSVASLYLGRALWRNPMNRSNRNIYLLGFRPEENVLRIPSVNDQKELLKIPETVLFDRLSRREFGPIGQTFSEGQEVRTEIGTQRVTVVGLFAFGATFIADGNVVASEQTFLQITGRPRGMIEIGLIRLKPDADLEAVRSRLVSTMPSSVLVLTKPEFIQKEMQFWRKNTAVGFIFGFGVLMGFIVGAVIVYQILYADVSDHLAEYATLKAIGFTNGFLSMVVLGEALILSVLGFLPGAALSFGLFRLCEQATQLSMRLPASDWTFVFALTLLMCVMSGVLAVRKVQSADPADVF